ncbi:mannose-specific lectin-like [Wolffia australiana]
MAANRGPSALLLLSSLLLYLLSLSSAATNILLSGQTLCSGQSPTEGKYAVTVRPECDLVLTDNGNVVVETNTAGGGTNCFATLQNDGNFVLYSGTGTALWSTNTARGFSYYILVLQPDRNIVLYGPAYWQTNTKVA